jgi:hypothetical protein
MTEELALRKVIKCTDRTHIRNIEKYLGGVRRSQMKNKVGNKNYIKNIEDMKGTVHCNVV